MCVNAGLIGKLRKNSGEEVNFILYGQKQQLKHVPGSFKTIVLRLKFRRTLCKTPVTELTLVKIFQIAVFTGISQRFRRDL